MRNRDKAGGTDPSEASQPRESKLSEPVATPPLPAPDPAPKHDPPQSAPSVPPKPDFSRFRLSQDFAAISGVEQIRTSVLVGRPKKTQFVRTKKGPENQLVTRVLEWGDQRETYLVEPSLCAVSPELVTVVIPTVLRVAATLEGIEFIWPLRVPDPERPNRWHVAAFEGAKIGEERWVRLVANMAAGEYDVFAARDPLGEPQWSGRTLDELLELAFKGRVIAEPDHPVLRALRGEVE